MFLTCVRSPKSVASPVVAIVQKSILFVLAGATYPKPIKPRVELEAVPPLLLAAAAVKSPKLVPFPVVAKVIYYMVLTFAVTGDG